MEPIAALAAAEAETRADARDGRPSTEDRLVERAQADPRGFAELYRLHYAAIGAYLYRRTGDVHATEDLLAETFLAALKGLRRYRAGRGPFRHWLYRIATNAANKRVRRLRVRSAELELPQELADPRPQPLLADPDPALRRALASLKPAHQAVLVLHHVEGLSVDEIARALGCRPGTVKSRLSRGRDALAARLGGGA